MSRRERAVGAILEILFPTRATCLGCGDERGCDEPFLCRTCRMLYQPSDVVSRREEWMEAGLMQAAFVFYYARPIRGLIRAFKFHGVKMLADEFGAQLARLMEKRRLGPYDMIVPVPLHPSRLRKRGYNQAELIARVLSDKCGIPVRTDVLRRVRKTRQQARLSHARRSENTANAFRAEKVDGMRVLLVDDVITTGSTVAACTRALRAMGATDVQAMSVAGVRGRQKRRPARYRFSSPTGQAPSLRKKA